MQRLSGGLALSLFSVLASLSGGCERHPAPIEPEPAAATAEPLESPAVRPVEGPLVDGVPAGLFRFSVSRGFLHPYNEAPDQSRWLPRVFVRLVVARGLWEWPWPLEAFEFAWGPSASARPFSRFTHMTTGDETTPTIAHDISLELAPEELPAFLEDPLLQMTIEIDVSEVLQHAEDHVSFEWLVFAPGDHHTFELASGGTLTLTAERVESAAGIVGSPPGRWRVSGRLSPEAVGRRFLSAHRGSRTGWMLPEAGPVPVLLLRPDLDEVEWAFGPTDDHAFVYESSSHGDLPQTLRLGVYEGLLAQTIVLRDFPVGW